MREQKIILPGIFKSMHKEILSPAQAKLLPLVKKFNKDFYLTGGTAIALHLGHRRSIDFDLFSGKEFRKARPSPCISAIVGRLILIYFPARNFVMRIFVEKWWILVK